MSSLLLSSKELTKDIIKYGVTPRKSLTLNIQYNLIPDEFKKDFWRGIFDGDGTFGIFGKKHILEVSLTTSKIMAENTKKEILRFFPNYKISCYNRKDCAKETYNLIFTTQKQGYEFLKFLYDNNSIHLKRKYEKFLNIKEYFENFNDYPD